MITVDTAKPEVLHTKKDRVFGFILLYGCLLLLGCLSCGEQKYLVDNKLYFESEVVAMRTQKNDEMLSQIVPTDKPLGGSLLVVIPTDEHLLEACGCADLASRRNMPRHWLDFQVQLHRNDYIAMVEAVRKRALFETVAWRQSADPEQEAFEADFALIRPASKGTDWLLRTRTTQNTTSVAVGPSSLSWSQEIMIWLNNIEEAAKKTKER